MRSYEDVTGIGQEYSGGTRNRRESAWPAASQASNAVVIITPSRRVAMSEVDRERLVPTRRDCSSHEAAEIAPITNKEASQCVHRKRPPAANRNPDEITSKKLL